MPIKEVVIARSDTQSKNKPFLWSRFTRFTFSVLYHRGIRFGVSYLFSMFSPFTQFQMCFGFLGIEIVAYLFFVVLLTYVIW